MTGERPPRDVPAPGESAPVRCEECGAVFPNSRALMLHVETAHVRGNL